MADLNAADYYWWKSNDPEKAVFAYLAHLENSQSNIQADNLKNMRLYGNYDYSGILNSQNYVVEPSYSTLNRITLNIVQSMVDTAVSKITKNKPKPYFLTDAGDFTLQRKAEKLSKFAEGQFYSTKMYQIMPRVFTDACIFGTGVLKIFRDGTEIKAERVFVDEIKVDNVESIYGEPRQMHQSKWIHKDVLKAKFPGHKNAIESAATPNANTTNIISCQGDMVKVVESWKLPTTKDKKDGKKTITISNATLHSEEYSKHYFPFVFIRWSTRPLGFWGQGIAEQLTGLQLEINKLLKTIQISMHLVSVPKLFVEASSKVMTSQLDNKIGSIIKWAGTKPEFGQLGAIPSELFTQLDRLYQRAFEIIGISQLSAQSAKPAGLNSGKAMRTYSEIETERFLDCGKRYEQGFLDATEIMLDYAKDIAEETNNYKVKVPGASFMSTIEWKDVSMDEDKYMMQIFPTSALSSTPSARLAEVQELMQAGLVSKEDGMKLLDFPDLKSYYNMTNSGVEDIERQIELMVDKGEYQTPEPFQNLTYGITKMQQAYLMYRSQGAPEETLELFRQWISDANELLQPPAPPMEPVAPALQQAEGAVGPNSILAGDPTQMGQPGAAPVSDLMPVKV